MVILKGRGLVKGVAIGTALVSRDPISFYGGVDSESGLVVEKGHQLEGAYVTGKVLVFPRGKGSTVGSYVLYRLRKLGKAPAAIINVETEAIIVTGCILAGIPLVDRLDKNPLEVIRTNDVVRVNGSKGLVEVLKKA
ncbi:MAG: DUF126 domain-containing protein [Candidatus Nezhaarchaeales archaeon]